MKRIGIMKDEKLHEETKYRIPYLKEQFLEVEKEVAHYITLNKNWNSYGASAMTVKTIKHSLKTLDTIRYWFQDNIGFLNNREFNIDTTPGNSGEVYIEIEYERQLNILFDITHNIVDCHASPLYMYVLDGKHTIADRHVNLKHFKDKVEAINDINTFLNDVFYKHKWRQ